MDEEYTPILQAVLFCLVRFNLKPRIATERNDAGETRISKILDLIQSSRYSIHDLSRCQSQDKDEYYRLNMPFELGLDFGCRYYGTQGLKGKVILVLEEQKYRYQATISDLAGSDIAVHKGDYQVAVRKVRNWLVAMPDLNVVIGAKQVLADYEDFQQWYWEYQKRQGFSDDDILDYSTAELLQAMINWRNSHRASL